MFDVFFGLCNPFLPRPKTPFTHVVYVYSDMSLSKGHLVFSGGKHRHLPPQSLGSNIFHDKILCIFCTAIYNSFLFYNLNFRAKIKEKTFKSPINLSFRIMRRIEQNMLLKLLHFGLPLLGIKSTEVRIPA